jgi:hypothetical protein
LCIAVNNSATVNVRLPSTQEISLELYDMQGKLIKNIFKGKELEGAHKYEVSLSDVS